MRQIPPDVDEGLLVQLFNTGRLNHSDTVVVNSPCTFTVPPRTGLKQKHCRELPTSTDVVDSLTPL